MRDATLLKMLNVLQFHTDPLGWVWEDPDAIIAVDPESTLQDISVTVWHSDDRKAPYIEENASVARFLEIWSGHAYMIEWTRDEIIQFATANDIPLI